MKTKGSFLGKAVGVLTFFLLVFAMPVSAYALTDNSVAAFLGRIPATEAGTPTDPNLPTDFEPGTFHINVMAYEQRVVADEKFACIISYAFSDNSTDPAENPVVNLTLSEEITPINFYDHHMQELDYDVTVLDNGDTKITFHLGQSMTPGTLGNIIAVAKLNTETLVDSTQPFCSAVISADNVDSVETNTMEISPLLHEVDWMLMTYQQAPESEPSPGSSATYGITLYGNSEDCELDFHDVVIKAEYPENAEVIESNDGVIDTDTHTVTWEYENLQVDDMIEQSLTVFYSEDYFTNDESSSTKSTMGGIVVSVTAKVEGSSDLYPLQRAYSHMFDPINVALGDPGAGASFEKAEYCQNDVATYVVNGIENNGNVAFDQLTITATMPEGLELAYIRTGKFNADVSVTVQYQTTSSNIWQTWAITTSASSRTLDVSLLDLEEKITKVRWVMIAGADAIDPGFIARDSSVQVLTKVTQDYGDYAELPVVVQAQVVAENETITKTITNLDEIRVMPIWPENLSEQRKQIIEKAFTLIGEVEYYLGGKSYAIGYDDAWGTYQYNSNSVKYENYGLDCSGYVVWTYINAGFPQNTVVNNFGLGTYYQWPNCYAINSDEMLPGDLGFKQPPTAAGFNHVGIIVGRDSAGMLLVAHCASSYNTVVVTPYAGTFYYMRRPYIYQ